MAHWRENSISIITEVTLPTPKEHIRIPDYQGHKFWVGPNLLSTVGSIKVVAQFDMLQLKTGTAVRPSQLTPPSFHTTDHSGRQCIVSIHCRLSGVASPLTHLSKHSRNRVSVTDRVQSLRLIPFLVLRNIHVLYPLALASFHKPLDGNFLGYLATSIYDPAV